LGGLSPRLLAVNEGLPLMAKVTNLKKLIWTGLANGNSGKFSSPLSSAAAGLIWRCVEPRERDGTAMIHTIRLLQIGA